MRTMAIEAFGGSDQLKPVDLPRPRPEAHEVLVRVVAAGVNPEDVAVREGRWKDLLPHEFPLVPGWDVAGVVEEFGDGTGRFRRGDRVWAVALKPTVQWGCYAEYVTVPEAHLAAMPTKLLYEEAASVPLAALTAFQCLFNHPGLGEESNVAIHSAAGGVGHFAIQLAKNAGAKVFGIGGTADQQFLLGLGATGAVDSERDDFTEGLRRLCPEGIDLVIDTVGGEMLHRSYSLLRPGGRLTSVVEQPDIERTRNQGASAEFFRLEPNAEQLGLIANLVDRKQLRTHVQKIYPLAAAAEAQEALTAGGVQGKLVLNL